MEKYEETQNLQCLLTKFSHANLIVKFYGKIPQAQWMMSLLCKHTAECWNQNYIAFCNSLRTTRQVLSILREFDTNAAAFLDGSADVRLPGYPEDFVPYKHFKLSVSVGSAKSYVALIKFIKGKLDLRIRPRFTAILINPPVEDVIDQYATLLDFLDKYGHDLH